MTRRRSRLPFRQWLVSTVIGVARMYDSGRTRATSFIKEGVCSSVIHGGEASRRRHRSPPRCLCDFEAYAPTLSHRFRPFRSSSPTPEATTRPTVAPRQPDPDALTLSPVADA
jgi:hypothetical protein